MLHPPPHTCHEERHIWLGITFLRYDAFTLTFLNMEPQGSRESRIRTRESTDARAPPRVTVSVTTYLYTFMVVYVEDFRTF